MKRKKIVAIFAITASTLLVTVLVTNKLVTAAAEGKLYNAPEALPYHKTGLLLGTARVTANGRPNQFYTNRIAAAAELLKTKKIKYLIISGDNGRADYNEPEDMRRDLMAAGIDSSVIFLDYAGFRTFDSVKRLKDIFGQDTVTVISQKFHNERALYIAGRLGITAVGYNAADVSTTAGMRTLIREKFARTKVFLDFWMGKKPRFSGPKVIIPA
jgi:SanA protein